MAILKRIEPVKPVIDLRGPQGNAFALISQAMTLGKQVGMSKEAIKTLTEEMMAGDYKHLVAVFDNTFGDYVDLMEV